MDLKQTCCSTRYRICMLLLVLLVLVPFIALLIAFLVISNQNTTLEHMDVPPLAVTTEDAKLLTESNHKIIIVGAGTTGLFAGYTLKFLGFDNFVILEASSSSYGGRVQESTDFVPEVSIDRGAEYIHVNPRILSDLLLYEQDDARNDIDIISYRPQTFRAYVDGKNHRRNWIRFFYREYKFKSATWFSYLRDFVVSYIEDHIELNKAVQSIDYSVDNEVLVTTTDGELYTANQALVTVPVAVLQHEKIEFSPDLPEDHWMALENIEIVPGLKVWIEFDERFYPDEQIFVDPWTYIFDDADSRQYLNALFRKELDNRNVLLYLNIGETAEELVLLSEEKIIAKLVEELDSLYDGKASEHYVKHMVMNWSKEPHILGAYTGGDFDDYEWTVNTVRRPVGSTQQIRFAGESTADGYTNVATVHGAAMEGRRVVQDLLLQTTTNLS